ncbi:MAG: HIT family protein [Kiritimatiellae bacterium]|nr:HIT family protein [Kiritimatiellia bacterium]
MVHDSNCIFCKIIAGEIPSLKIYEDEDLMSFMDINPFSKGHVLVVPKYHAQTITDLPEEVLVKLAKGVQKIAGIVRQRLGCEGFNVLQNNGAAAGQTVPHVHVHIIPRNPAPHLDWKSKKYDSDEEMHAYHKKLMGEE